MMVIAAHFEEAEGRLREPRRKLQLEARGALPSGDASIVLIYDISATGFLIESPLALAKDPLPACQRQRDGNSDPAGWG